MLWFKHIVNSTSDPDMMESEIKFGTAGPYVFWRTLEILAREDAIEEPLVVNFKVFKAWFPSTSAPKLLKVLSYFDHKLRISCSKDGDDIKIFCDKLALISDTYTKYIRRNVEATAKNSCARRKKKKKEERRKNIKGKSDLVFQDNLDNDEFKYAWNEWSLFRKELKKPNTNRSIQMQLKQLSEYGTEKAIKSIENSIRNGYTGLFEPNDKKSVKSFGRQEVDRDELKRQIERDMEVLK